VQNINPKPADGQRQTGQDQSPQIQGRSWFAAHRNPEALELIKLNPCAFLLLYVIAYRARWADGFNAHGLRRGEALVGDHEACGMTEQNYRTAKQFLAKHGFATFRPTNKGTVASLANTRVFECFIGEGNEQNNERVTDGQRTGNGQVTTNYKGTRVQGEGEEARAREGTPIETPPGWPDESTAKSHAAFVGCSPEFAAQVWNEAGARAGRDCFGQPIADFRRYLASRWAQARSKQVGRWTFASGTPPTRRTPTAEEHAKGF
jgi:hypothetical protein